MAANLTRDEARERAALISGVTYQVELDLTGGDTTFRSVSTIRFECARPGAGTFLNLAAPEVRSITLNGSAISPEGAFDGERVTVGGLAASNELVITAECAYSRSGEGLHRFTDPADGNVYMYSDLETFDAHRIYACFDQPDLKASYELDRAGAGGLAGHLQHGPGDGRRGGGRRTGPARGCGTSRPRR